MEIVAFEQGSWTSYSACGIPYFVAGDISDLEQLVARSPQQFRDQHQIEVRLHHRVTAIDAADHNVEVVNLDTGATQTEAWDKLLIGTGARSIRPDLPGVDLPFVNVVKTLDDAVHLQSLADQLDCRHITVVGAGYVGLEMAEAFIRWGAEVTVVQGADEVMRTLDPDFAARVRATLCDLGVDVRLGAAATGFSEGTVHTESGDVHADLVVLGIGVLPNSELAAEAGLETGVKGAIVVDEHQRTSAPGIWAAGDCCQSTHLVSGRPVHIALGTVANRQSRVAGIDIAGGAATFPGVLGSAVTKICELEIGLTGLGAHEATQAGFDHAEATIDSTTRAGYFPGAAPITVRLRYEVPTGRVLGGQILGGQGAAKRIDTVATAITAGMTVGEVRDLDLAYAPPFSPVWDPVQIAARVAAGRLS